MSLHKTNRYNGHLHGDNRKHQDIRLRPTVASVIDRPSTQCGACASCPRGGQPVLFHALVCATGGLQRTLVERTLVHT